MAVPLGGAQRGGYEATGSEDLLRAVTRRNTTAFLIQKKFDFVTATLVKKITVLGSAKQ
jgi:hypothetical protein